MDVVMDDESYFTYGGSQMPSNAGYYASAGGDVPFHIMYRPESKYPRKLLVWIAISPRGMTKPVMPSRNNVNGDVYRKKCLENVLIPFLEENYLERDMIFWPDLASATMPAKQWNSWRRRNYRW